MKHALTLDGIDAQNALELPDRHMLGLITVVVTDVLNNLSVNVEVKNNNIAVQVCAAVDVISSELLAGNLTCAIGQ